MLPTLRKAGEGVEGGWGALSILWKTHGAQVAADPRQRRWELGPCTFCLWEPDLLGGSGELENMPPSSLKNTATVKENKRWSDTQRRGSSRWVPWEEGGDLREGARPTGRGMGASRARCSQGSQESEDAQPG